MIEYFPNNYVWNLSVAMADELVELAGAPGRPAPVMVYINGLDSSKEMLYWSGLSREWLKCGISTLHIDQPGSGEALRAHGSIATILTNGEFTDGLS